MQKSRINKGDLFIFNSRWSIHENLCGCVGIVLGEQNSHKQYKTQVGHKILWLLREHMEFL
jgi:hypothetical protein